ncbi:MAG TPA: DUF368 domain-containing protein [Candidatus Fournierella merdigallinarum]|nr:DUF368 domain-containing protein [Candidatus Fournierella merdigallinarum]
MKGLLDILRGVAIGVANIIPGVSGGTMAVSMGIYDKIIGAVSGLFKHFKQSILTLLPLGVGMGIGIVAFGYALRYLLAEHTLATCLTFVGLILGGLPILWGRLRQSWAQKARKGAPVGEVICFAALLAFGVGMALMQGGDETIKTLTLTPGTALLLAALGLIASATMVIPGVSGSMVLMVLGYYNTILDLVTGCVDGLVAGDFGLIFHNVCLLAPFAVGVALGIFGIAKIIEYLFAHFPSQTFAGIIGLIVSSPFAMLYSSGALARFSLPGLIAGLVLGAAGAWVTLLMGKADPE